MAENKNLKNSPQGGLNPTLIEKLENVVDQAATLNPDVSPQVDRKSVNNMTPEEMVETLNKYIQKAKDDVSEARSRYSRRTKSANNISYEQDLSDINGKSDLNVNKTDVMDKSEGWAPATPDKSAKSAL